MRSDLRNETYRRRFSSTLPWVAYDTNESLSLRGQYGWVHLRVQPLAFAGEKTADTLEGLLRLNVPEDSVLQFILVADDHVNHYIDTYKSLKTRDNALVSKSVDRYGAFLLGGTEGLEKLNNMPVRDFRLIVAFKLPIRQWEGGTPAVAELKSAIFEILGGARLFPSVVECEDLVCVDAEVFQRQRAGHGSL
jgi:conjugal transfer ATP-binding protein TraC